MPSQHRETLFLERRAPSLLVVTCLIVVREIARAAARSRELVERVRRASSRFARAVTVYTYTRIRIRIKRFTVYTVASFWRTRAEPNPPQPAPPRMCLRIFLFSCLDRPTNKLSGTFTLRARQTSSFRRFSFPLRSRISPPRFYSFLGANRGGAPRRATAPCQRIF